MINFNILLYDKFETLDAMGPAEVVGELSDHYLVQCYSKNGGLIRSSQNICVETLPFSAIFKNGVLLIPGGEGARRLVGDVDYIEKLRDIANQSEFVLSVCTGSALIAKTGLLDGRNATTNKAVYNWATGNGPRVNWIKQARWVVDEKYYTSSGVSAGIDMILGFVSDRHGQTMAEVIAKNMEYVWNTDQKNDPFSYLTE